MNRTPLSDEDILNFQEWFYYIYSKKLLIIFTVLVFMAGAYLYTKTIVPNYQVDSLLQVKPKQASMPGLEEVTILLDRGASSLRGAGNREESIIRSRAVMSSVINKLKLNITAVPRYMPYFGKAYAAKYKKEGLNDAFFDLTQYAWGGEYISLDVFEVADKNRVNSWNLTLKENNKYVIYNLLGDIVLEGRIGVESRSKELRVLINKITARTGMTFKIVFRPVYMVANQLGSRIKIEEQGRRTGILRLSLRGTDKQRIFDTLNEIVNTYYQYNLDQHSLEASKMLSFIDNQLPKIRDNIEIAESKLHMFRSNNDALDLKLQAQNLVASLGSIEKKIANLELKRDLMLVSFTKRHPKVKSINLKINRLNSDRKLLMNSIEKLPKDELRLVKLTRAVESQSKLYDNVLKRQNALNISKKSMTGNVSVIDYAHLPYAKLPEKKYTIMLAAIMLGFILGIMIAALLKILNRGLSDIKTIERKTGLSVLSNIMYSKNERKLIKSNDKKSILALASPNDVSVEGLRGLRTAVHFGMINAKNNIVAISGPSPSVGKSFVSMNFAAVYSSSNKKVLLIDADLRRGELHLRAGFNKNILGLSDMLSGTHPDSSVIQSLNENFDFLPRGSISDSSSELLSGNDFVELLDKFSSDYDVVIIDTPPILLVTDANLVAQHSGQLLMVVKHNETNFEQLQQSIAMFEQSGVKVDGLVMNFSGKKSGYTYDYQYKT